MSKIDELTKELNTIIDRDIIAGYDRVWASYFKRTEPFGWCGGEMIPGPGGLVYRASNGEEQRLLNSDEITVLLRFPDVLAFYNRAYKTLFFWKRIIVLLDGIRAESAIPGTISADALQAVKLLAEIKALLK